MIDMVGIGPFVVMPFVVARFHSGLFLWAWIFGAVTAFLDGMIWSELGASYPLAGGTYNFHRIAFGEKGGKLMSFLFVWQTVIQAPLVVASAAIGFSQYLTYIIDLSDIQQKIVSGGSVILVLLLLYRKIESVGRISLFFGMVVICTITWISDQWTISPATSHSINTFGQRIVFSICFLGCDCARVCKDCLQLSGYYNVCHLGGEIKSPEKNIPRSIFISITGIAILYLLMNISVMGVVALAYGKRG